jgi:hypothetical protein
MERELDGMLTMLIETILERGHAEAELPLVLHVGGLVVSGTAIPASAYFQQVGVGLQVGGHDLTAVFQELADLDRGRETEKEQLEQRLDQATEGGRDLTDDEREQFALEFEETETAYLHLKEVEIQGASTTPIRLPFWRARLGDVSGWALRRPTDQPRSS